MLVAASGPVGAVVGTSALAVLGAPIRAPAAHRRCWGYPCQGASNAPYRARSAASTASRAEQAGQDDVSGGAGGGSAPRGRSPCATGEKSPSVLAPPVDARRTPSGRELAQRPHVARAALPAPHPDATLDASSLHQAQRRPCAGGRATRSEAPHRRHQRRRLGPLAPRGSLRSPRCARGTEAWAAPAWGGRPPGRTPRCRPDAGQGCEFVQMCALRRVRPNSLPSASGRLRARDLPVRSAPAPAFASPPTTAPVDTTATGTPSTAPIPVALSTPPAASPTPPSAVRNSPPSVTPTDQPTALWVSPRLSTFVSTAT